MKHSLKLEFPLQVYRRNGQHHMISVLYFVVPYVVRCFSKYPQDGQMMSLWLPFGMFCRVFHGAIVAQLYKFAPGHGKIRYIRAIIITVLLNKSPGRSSGYTIHSDSEFQMLKCYSKLGIHY